MTPEQAIAKIQKLQQVTVANGAAEAEERMAAETIGRLLMRPELGLIVVQEEIGQFPFQFIVYNWR